MLPAPEWGVQIESIFMIFPYLSYTCISMYSVSSEEIAEKPNMFDAWRCLKETNRRIPN